MIKSTKITLHAFLTACCALFFFVMGFAYTPWFLLGFPLSFIIGYIDFERRLQRGDYF